MYTIAPFKFIGIAVRTSNSSGKAAEDLGALWGRFFEEQIGTKISGKVSEDIYAIYTDYESDYTGKYTCMIGYQVDTLEKLGVGLVSKEFAGGKHIKFVAKGKMPEAVVTTWQEIWAKDSELDRKYTADFEVYGSKCQQGENSEVDIFIAVK
ncbi:GyrI-like domain-containing protein [Algoriphagus aquimarinus]|uniref:Predicted transcriptional regulator YdeE, contains AraC-type DNA-binding domain n=1 Tax=Algoriphagus aquimarinus TaxID=237018 RepID=A0A1I0VMY0_9BACT|nr:GyrI-like domain-containing protein [Algoriphagus aquimarinus]SFA77588.1 Predicted transcriptional regulator YdeE, contains AraC-type DNA-binding domain [Algoriphagus aquimarinus]|tara:strand:+ start:290280 stop:290735 length:456 start_codon:yes stop_codon:yes gene_type:complete